MGGGQKDFYSPSEIPIKQVYTPADLEEIAFNYLSNLGNPGTYPFVRGIDSQMYRANMWIMGQYAGYGSAEDSNKRYKQLIEQGATGFSIALDLPTQMGYDSDHPLASGEVGKVGVAIDSLKDMEILLDGIALNKVKQIRTTANAIGPIFIALFLAIAEKKGVSPTNFSVLIQNDVLKEYVARGTYIFPIKPAIKLCTDVIEYCSVNLPHWIPINFCGYHMRDAGATAVQEIAFTFANAITYIESALNRGLSIDEFAPNLASLLGVSPDLFEEVAKLRASRKIWAKLMKERFRAEKPESLAFRIFCYTSGSFLTAQQPLNNIIRVTLEALAAVLGGVQILATSSYDEAYATPSSEASTISLRTQQIIAYESGVTKTVDPLGGSYYLERLTHDIEKKVWEYIEKIDETGGAMRAIENRFFQNEIEESAYRYQKEVESKDKIIVGVNEFKANDFMKIETLKVNPDVEAKNVEKLKELKRSRDELEIGRGLNALKKAAAEGKNVIPATCNAIKAYATIGEICDTLKEVYGEY